VCVKARRLEHNYGARVSAKGNVKISREQTQSCFTRHRPADVVCPGKSYKCSRRKE